MRTRTSFTPALSPRDRAGKRVPIRPTAVFFLILCITLAPGTAGAWGEYTVRSIGMAGSYSALARGWEVCAWNPANLGYPAPGVFSMGIISLGAVLGNTSLSISEYNNYNGEFLYENDKDYILSLIPGDGLGMDMAVEGNALGLSYRNIAFMVKGGGYAWGKIPEDFVALMLEGNQPGKTYRFTEDNMNGQGWADAEISISAGFTLPWEKTFLRNLPLEGISTGLTLKYIVGLAYSGISSADGGLHTVAETGDIVGWGDVSMKTATGGNGFGADLGFLAWWKNGLNLSFSLINLIGSIGWSTEVEEHYYSFADTMSADDWSDDDEDEDFFEIEEYTLKGGSFSSGMPVFMRVGCSYPLTPAILVAGEYLQGFSRGPGISTTPRVSTGLEYSPLPWLPLRCGLSLGGADGYTLSMGMGLDFTCWNMDFAIANQRGIANGASGLNLAVGTGIAF